MATQRMQILLSARDKASKVVKGIRRGLKKLGKTAKKVGKSIGGAFKRVTKSMFSLKSALVGVAGIAGLGYLMKRSMNATDEMAKMSRAIGVTVADLQRLRHAADLGGLGATQLDKAIQKLSINLADVAGGTGEALDEFKAFNISAVNADGSMRNVMDVLADVADVTQKLGNTTERTNLMYKLFGARGAKMVNVLKDGSEALRENMAQADALGFVLGQNVVEGVERANDAFGNLKKAMGGVFDKLSASLAPALEGFSNYWSTWWGTFSNEIQPALDWIVVNLQSMGTNFASAEESGKAWGETVRDWLIKMTEKARAFFTEIEDGETDWDRLKQTFINVTEKIRDFFTEVKDGKTDWERLTESAGSFLTLLNNIAAAINTVVGGFQRIQKWSYNLGVDLADTVQEVKNRQKNINANLLDGTRASGGGIMANRSYLVGERGAEVFTPTTSGRISASAGGSTNITNIYTNATAHGINNALAARGDSANRGARVGMNIARATGFSGYGNLSMARAR